ncbi:MULTISPECIES: hypothetical protein [unclassified Novosphingobium]|uniref:hypothetical protein n=1 Tax=unclassified Novosphingobium TaxID=2644732 RepID=UPI00146A9E70|nr:MULTISPECIES: hypothetical protein [unclassified Novosphingobium]NMN87344.1 hypothetical protein [Novosphingobium sp. SG916]
MAAFSGTARKQQGRATGSDDQGEQPHLFLEPRKLSSDHYIIWSLVVNLLGPAYADIHV